MQPNQQFARELYNTYVQHAGGVNYEGKPCPKWDDLPDAIRGHWQAVAETVRPISFEVARVCGVVPADAVPAGKYTPDSRVAGQIERAFVHHEPKGDQPQRYAALRVCASQYAKAIATLTPPSREQSIALTHLEDASMWASAAIARNE